MHSHSGSATSRAWYMPRMYIRQLHVENVKLLRNFELNFLNAQGQPRMWTVILGENGTCKTTILQAIALAASGPARATTLADIPSLPDKRLDQPTVRIEAEFEFSQEQHRFRDYPGLDAKPDAPPRLCSRLKLRSRRTDFSGASWYRGPQTGNLLLDHFRAEHGEKEGLRHLDEMATPGGGPLDEARSLDLHRWFVAGYGTDRRLRPPDPSITFSADPALDRLKPLFSQRFIVGTGFADLFRLRFPDDKLAQAYSRVLKQVLIEGVSLLPRVDEIDLRGRGGGGSASNLIESHRVDYHVGDRSVRLPMVWLSQGYQAMVAWVSDVVGQIILEAKAPIEGHEMEGIVLLDEVDLHLHPMWQVSVIHALKRVFPRIQFVVTTHSPMVLPYLRQDEVFILEEDEEGSVRPMPAPQSPALLSGSGIYAKFFGLPQVFPKHIGDALWKYMYIAADPTRSDDEDVTAHELRGQLVAAGIDPGPEPVDRTRRP